MSSPLTHNTATLKETIFTFVFQSRKGLREAKGPAQVTSATLPVGVLRHLGEAECCGLGGWRPLPGVAKPGAMA